jgi:hypothetical protein
MKMISRKMIFFSVFGCIPENTSENILQCCEKDKAEEAGVRRAFFENGYEKIERKPFSKF